MNRRSGALPGTQFKGTVPYTTQGALERLARMRNLPYTPMAVAQVKTVYSARGTCDVNGPNGAVIRNVPVRTTGGLLNNGQNVYGSIEMPQKDNWVLLDFVNGNQAFPIIVGTLLAYAYSPLQGSQTPVNSSSKAFTKKLLEANKDKTFRKIFPSGTTIEVGEDGTIVIETPSGSYIQIDESNSGKTTISARGNTFIMDSGKVTINGNLEVDQ